MYLERWDVELDRGEIAVEGLPNLFDQSSKYGSRERRKYIYTVLLMVSYLLFVASFFFFFFFLPSYLNLLGVLRQLLFSYVWYHLSLWLTLFGFYKVHFCI